VTLGRENEKKRFSKAYSSIALDVASCFPFAITRGIEFNQINQLEFMHDTSGKYLTRLLCLRLSRSFLNLLVEDVVLG
jgi:hypothetical protein